MLNTLFVITQVMLLLANWMFFRRLLHPGVIHSLLWLTMLVCHIYLPHRLKPMNEVLGFMIVLSSAAFMLGCLVAGSSGDRGGKNELITRRLVDAPGSSRIALLYLAIAALMVWPFTTRAMELASHRTTNSFLMDIRFALSYPELGYEGGYGWLSYAVPVAFSATFILISLDRGQRSRVLVFLSVCLSLYYAVLMTGRTFVFQLIIPCAVILLAKAGYRVSVMSFVKLVVVLGCVFIGFGYALNKLETVEMTTGTVVSIYFLGPMSAMSQILEMPREVTDGAQTFRTFIAIASRLGAEVEPVELVKDFVFVPYPANTFTVFRPYYEDFGIGFIFLTQFVFGVLHARLYKWALNGGELATIFLVYLCMRSSCSFSKISTSPF